MKFHTLNFLQLPSIFLLGAGFYFPVLIFLSGGNPLFPGESFFDGSFFVDFLRDSWNLEVIGFTFFQAILSAVLSILFGFPGAWLLTYYDFSGKRWFRLITYLPFVLPSILVVLSMVLFLGNNGWVNRGLMFLLGTDETPIQFLYSISGILIAHVFYNFPIAMKIIGDQWERLASKYSQVALSLGAGKTKLFFSIILPLLMPSIVSAFILIFFLCMNSFAIILVLGGGIRYTTIEVLIYQLARIELDYSSASSLAFLQYGFSLICIAILFIFREQKVEQLFTMKNNLHDKIRELCPKALFGFFWILIVLIFALGPVFAIVFDSLHKFDNGEWIFTFYWYEKLFSINGNNSFLFSLWNSFKIGFTSSVMSTFLGLGLVSIIINKRERGRRFWEVLAISPLALSAVVFGIAWFHFYQEYLAEIIPLIYVVILMHAIMTTPYWIRIVLPSLERIPQQWHIEAKILGKKSLQYGFIILWPWLRKTFLIAFLFSFSLSLGELNSIMMIADESIRTIPIEIFDSISGYRISYASAVAVILLFIFVSTFFLVEILLGYFNFS